MNNILSLCVAKRVICIFFLTLHLNQMSVQCYKYPFPPSPQWGREVGRGDGRWRGAYLSEVARWCCQVWCVCVWTCSPRALHHKWPTVGLTASTGHTRLWCATTSAATTTAFTTTIVTTIATTAIAATTAIRTITTTSTTVFRCWFPA